MVEKINFNITSLSNTNRVRRKSNNFELGNQEKKDTNQKNKKKDIRKSNKTDKIKAPIDGQMKSEDETGKSQSIDLFI